MEHECKQWKTKGLIFHNWKHHQCVQVWMSAKIFFPPKQHRQSVVAQLQQLPWKSSIIKLWWIWILKSNKKHWRAFGGTRVQHSYHRCILNKSKIQTTDRNSELVIRFVRCLNRTPLDQLCSGLTRATPELKANHWCASVIHADVVRHSRRPAGTRAHLHQNMREVFIFFSADLHTPECVYLQHVCVSPNKNTTSSIHQ